jgi:hypothetical protein
MPSQAYALEENGSRQLKISWKPFWKNITIQLDGEAIVTIPGQKQLAAGQEFRLPDGSMLKVQLAKTFTGYELRVLRNGQPLAGSASDPEARLKTAYNVVFFVAGLNIVLGLVAWAFQVAFLQSMGIGLVSAIFGAGFLVLGYLIRHKSMAALVIAIAVFTLDGILGIVLFGAPWNIGRIALLVPMIQGVGAVRAIKKQEERPSRKTKTIIGVLAALLLLCFGMCAAGTLVAFLVKERVVITDASKVASAARSIAEYDLPPGYQEEMVLDFFLFKMVMISPAQSSSKDLLGPVFGLGQIPGDWLEEDELDQSMFKTGDFEVQHVELQEALICGQQVTLFVSEGTDREGNELRDVTSDWFRVNGKSTIVYIVGRIEDWDQAQVDAFIRSIR